MGFLHNVRSHRASRRAFRAQSTNIRLVVEATDVCRAITMPGQALSRRVRSGRGAGGREGDALFVAPLRADAPRSEQRAARPKSSEGQKECVGCGAPSFVRIAHEGGAIHAADQNFAWNSELPVQNQE
jgi:hypothetical protein